MGNIGGNVDETFYCYFLIHFFFIVFSIFTFIESNLNNINLGMMISRVAGSISGHDGNMIDLKVG